MYICVYTWRLYRVACRTHMMGRSNRNLCAFLARLTRQKENIEMGGGGEEKAYVIRRKGGGSNGWIYILIKRKRKKP